MSLDESSTTYPGLDITAEFLPFVFLRRDGTEATAEGGGGGASASDTLGRFVRLADDGLGGSGSASGAGLDSRAGALRFREDTCDRADEAVAVVAAEVVDGPGEFAACRADARVILEDMSIWFGDDGLRHRGQHLCTIVQVGRDNRESNVRG